ncbi:MAG: hypothetical protein WCA21_20370 [Terracidiphilus sp.]|jgi:hypothetical protein
MRFGSSLLAVIFAACCGLLALSSYAQAPVSTVFAPAELPDAPQPQFEMAQAEPPAQPAPSSSASQTAPPQPDAANSQHEKAEEQIKEQEKQRVVGVLPQFNISYRSDAVSMTASQKMRLAFRSSVDPVAFGAAFVVAGYHEAFDEDKGFGWGIEGYGKRSGAAYLDAFDGTIIGNGILPSLLHQDPRYFRLGHGTITHRLLYSLATNVVCKHDNTHKWEPNYSNVGGNIISGAISNLYYPSNGSGISQTFTNGFLVTAEGGIGSIFDEFWPDISRKFLHKDPTHGLDAQARAADKAAKQAGQQQ